MKTLALVVAAASLALCVTAASAHPPEEHGKMAGMNHDMKGMSPHMSMASKDFTASMKTMDHAMMMAKGSSVDATFARKMIAHHQGAIDMAKVELEHGTDAQAKQQAQMTIDENMKGIAQLRDWLSKHGG